MGQLRVWSAAALAGAVLALPSNGQVPADDPHLMVLPLAAEDIAHVTAVTAPVRDFSVAEPFESRPGGAATGPGRREQARMPFPDPPPLCPLLANGTSSWETAFSASSGSRHRPGRRRLTDLALSSMREAAKAAI